MFTNIIWVFLLAITLTIGFSCKKSEISTEPLATLIVTNAIVSGTDAKLNSNIRDSVQLYSFKAFGIKASQNTPILLYPTTNSKGEYYNKTQAIETNSIYSLYLLGTTQSVEDILVKETIPAYYSDSTIGVRIANLSSNSNPINITLSSEPNSKLFSGISYKQISEFVKIPASKILQTNQPSFEVRDMNNQILATYKIPSTPSSLYPGISTTLSVNRNITLVIKGIFNTTTGKDAFGVFPVANY